MLRDRARQAGGARGDGGRNSYYSLRDLAIAPVAELYAYGRSTDRNYEPNVGHSCLLRISFPDLSGLKATVPCIVVRTLFRTLESASIG